MRNKNRTATIDWILQKDWELAITLTFKKDCTEHRARKTMRRLWNGIDRQLYHKAFKKQGKRVERVCAFEKGQSGTHYHYHIATSPPKDLDISFDKYRLMIAKEWNNLSSAGYINKLQPIYDNKGWAKYITKEITTTNTDVIDEVTTHLN